MTEVLIKMALHSTEEKERFFSKIIELAADSVVALNEKMELFYFNKEAEKTFGYTSEEIQGKHLNMLIPERFHKQHALHVRDFSEGEVVARLMNKRNNLTVQCLRHDGSEFSGEISLLKMEFDEKKVFVAIVRDITRHKELENELRILSEYDSLTGILNRRKIEEVVKQEMDCALRYDRAFSLLLLDIDHFKKVNDNFGHDIGDRALKHLIAVCQDNLCKVDFFGRWGGEEFIVLLPEVGSEGISLVAEKLRKAIEQNPLIIDGTREVPLTISIGGTVYDKSEIPWETLFKQMDNALYQAKNQGRNRCCINQAQFSE
jgi:diguanylate cyclase (GGDEF)-like protein/PAS domain S-box-containing protein